MKKGWIWVEATFFTVGLEIENGIITYAPAICKYSKGQTPYQFKTYLKNRKILKQWKEFPE